MINPDWRDRNRIKESPDTEDDHTPRSLADDLADDERLMYFPKLLSLILLALVVAFLVIQVAWQLGKMMV